MVGLWHEVTVFTTHIHTHANKYTCACMQAVVECAEAFIEAFNQDDHEDMFKDVVLRIHSKWADELVWMLAC